MSMEEGVSQADHLDEAGVVALMSQQVARSKCNWLKLWIVRELWVAVLKPLPGGQATLDSLSRDHFTDGGELALTWIRQTAGFRRNAAYDAMATICLSPIEIDDHHWYERQRARQREQEHAREQVATAQSSAWRKWPHMSTVRTRVRDDNEADTDDI